MNWHRIIFLAVVTHFLTSSMALAQQAIGEPMTILLDVHETQGRLEGRLEGLSDKFDFVILLSGGILTLIIAYGSFLFVKLFSIQRDYQKTLAALQDFSNEIRHSETMHFR